VFYKILGAVAVVGGLVILVAIMQAAMNR